MSRAKRVATPAVSSAPRGDDGNICETALAQIVIRQPFPGMCVWRTAIVLVGRDYGQPLPFQDNSGGVVRTAELPVSVPWLLAMSAPI